MKFLAKLFRRPSIAEQDASAQFGLVISEDDRAKVQEVRERQEWMDARGFKPVLNPLEGTIAAGFDRNQEYEFMRAEWDEPQVFAMKDAHPAFNIWGLRYRPLHDRVP